jgi:succinate dehydrogenase / fumarate reductase flavoprotein subunit
LKEAARSIDVRPGQEGWAELEHVLDLRAGLIAAEATLLGAIQRRESRGAHQRSDFPRTNPELQVNFYVRRDSDSDRLEISSESVPPVSKDLARWLETGPLEVAGERLLE